MRFVRRVRLQAPKWRRLANYEPEKTKVRSELLFDFLDGAQNPDYWDF